MIINFMELFVCGIDTDHANGAINYDMPDESDAYLHRVRASMHFFGCCIDIQRVNTVFNYDKLDG